jgi:hypothetical protein
MTDYRTKQGDQVTHSEEAGFAGLTVVNFRQEAASVEQTYKNFVVLNINNVGLPGYWRRHCRQRGPDATREIPAVIAVWINWQLARERPGRLGWRRGS